MLLLTDDRKLTMAHLDKEEKKHAKAIKEIGKKLYACGWKQLSFQYSGSGDSCSELTFTIENEEDTFGLCDLASTDLPKDFSEEELTDHFLELLPAGFENNEGGAGEVTLDTKTGKISVRHATYYVEEEIDEWTL